jgi:hypothetical protein
MLAQEKNSGNQGRRLPAGMVQGQCPTKLDPYKDYVPKHIEAA